MNTLFVLIALPVFAGSVFLLSRKMGGRFAGWATVFFSLVNAAAAVRLFGRPLEISLPWAGFGINLSFRAYAFSHFVLLASAFFTLVVALYSSASLEGQGRSKFFFSGVLLSLGLVNGAVLADNLVVMLFFWEGLLLTLFGLIAIGQPGALKTAIKAFIVVGLSDLCLLVGIGLVAYLSGTLTMSQLRVPAQGLGALAFLLMSIGAVAKAGSLPFHSWIPDAATDAPLPFMAFLPASLEKLLGIYLLARITLDFFALQPGSPLSWTLMVLGAVTILVAVMMALIQKEYKRLLSYHAISQVGYMILGIGTCVPAGIVGGVFHMVNHALYKSCLFLTAGSVEKQTGTTDLRKVGGLAGRMPITATCFVIAAASISGVPPFNGFFSKELVYAGALERSFWLYAAALLGSFLTAASFLKLGHSVFFTKWPRRTDLSASESSWRMTLPMIAIAVLCVFFGLWNEWPIKHLVAPATGVTEVHGGWHLDGFLVLMTTLALLAAVANHLFGVKRSGSAVGASDHIHHAPVLGTIYGWAEKRYLDPYDIGLKISYGVSMVFWFFDRAIDAVFNKAVPACVGVLSTGLRRAQSSGYVFYAVWAMAGFALLLFMNR